MTGVLVFLSLIAGLIIALRGGAPDALGYEQNQMSLVYYVCWIALAGAAIIATFRNNWGAAIRYAAIWLMLLLALVAGYSIRDDMRQFGMGILAALVPGLAITIEDGVASLRRAQDGHFYVWALAEGQDIRFVVDTGATMVVLTANDAGRIGLDPARLEFSIPVNTANGATTAASIQIQQLEIAGIMMRNVEAAVMRDDQLRTSLLGLAFLGRLSSYSFEGDTLILKR